MDAKTDRFRQILQWLKKNRGVKTQEDLADTIGVNINTISRARTGKRLPTDDLLYRIKEKYDCPFDVSWMRADDAADKKTQIIHPDIIERGSSSIIELYAQLIKEVEALRTDITAELTQVREIRAQLNEEREQLQSITSQLTIALSGATLRGYHIEQPTIHQAAEENQQEST